jgi:hypothetical protein
MIAEPSVYDSHAPRLLKMGAHPLVIMPGTKRPAYAGWTDPGKGAVATPQPDAGVGIRLGKQATEFIWSPLIGMMRRRRSSRGKNSPRW